MGNDIEVRPAVGEAELLQALAIREVVFIEEQGVPESLERDADDARAFHLLATHNKHAVGTGRLLPIPAPPNEQGQWGKVGRMAVLNSYRSQGVGSLLLQGLEAEALRRGYSGILLHAQLLAREFYTRHGYGPHGTVFEEAGIAHLEMTKILSREKQGTNL